MMRHMKTSIKKAQTLTDEKSMSLAVSLSLHECASVVKNCFMFKGGLALEEKLRKEMRLKIRKEQIFPEEKISKMFLIAQSFFPSAFHYILYVRLPVAVNRKIQIIKREDKKPWDIRIEKDVNWSIKEN